MKIAILGGGCGAMTAAYWLTNPPKDGPPVDHDITIYQLGWRLGGKGAAGRNLDAGSRIEEHGLHIWMGFYANAFRMMRAAYGELNRPPGTPLATWRDAFEPQTVVTMMEDEKRDGVDEWLRNEWIVTYPLRPGYPGDQTSFPTPSGYLPLIVDWAIQRIESLFGGAAHVAPKSALPDTHHAHLSAILQALKTAVAHAEKDVESELFLLALEGVQLLIGVGFALDFHSVELRRLLQLLDMAVATALGIVRDLSSTNDWTAIDDQEWRSWLKKHGMHKETEWCSAVRSLYDLVFAFHDGHARHPESADIAAGTAACATVRIVFDFYESLFMRMQASMGETIFTPLYEVLKKRGVKFKFFHRLRDVVPSADGARIDALHFGVQATAKDTAGYDPLIDVKGVGCWPSTPKYDLLKEGDELKAKKIDLEDYNAPWPDVEELVLESGKDFDLAVFGLSLGAVPFVCSQVLAQKEDWRQMVDKVKIVTTQAFQFWWTRNVADLGWRPAVDGRCLGERAVLSCFIEPCDTWADMSHLLPLEDWDVPVKNISYFCGPIRTGSTLQDVIDGARTYVDNDIDSLLINTRPDGRFRYDWLAVNNPRAGVTDDERFRSQFFRINNQPTETYVLSVAGSTKYRLDPANPGYENLVLAGDWVRNGFAIGCVESAVLGGMKGVQRFCPGMVIVE